MVAAFVGGTYQALSVAVGSVCTATERTAMASPQSRFDRPWLDAGYAVKLVRVCQKPANSPLAAISASTATAVIAKRDSIGSCSLRPGGAGPYARNSAGCRQLSSQL